MGPDVDVCPGFVRQVVDQPAENVEIIEIFPAFGFEKGKGAIEGAVPDTGPGPFEAFGVEGKGREEDGLCQEKTPVGRFVVLAGGEIIMVR
jgi:hypothetical protein